MITPGLFYRLCLLQGACLAAGWGIPGLIQSITSAPHNWTLQNILAAWVTLLGTWGLLTAVTGLLLLRQLRKGPTARTQEIVPSGSPAIPAEPKLSHKLSLYRADDMDDVPEHHLSAEWKSQWRNPRVKSMNSVEEAQEVTWG